MLLINRGIRLRLASLVWYLAERYAFRSREVSDHCVIP
jgi:hypothetical protein